MRGRFIALEGGEGAGKSTQVTLLAKALEGRGLRVHVTREPGGTEGAEAIRDLLVRGGTERWDAMGELLLFLTARRDHVVRVIRPKLAEGIWVLTDRYQDSTTAYQGAGRGLGIGFVENLYRQVMGNFHTDLTCVLEVPVEEGLKRARASKDALKDDRFEAEALAFHERLRGGFQEIVRRSRGRAVAVSAEGSVDKVQARLVKAVEERFGL